MAQRESRLSRSIMQELRAMGAFCHKNHGTEFTMAGLPDIEGCYKGHYFAFETKTPDKRANVSEAQLRVMEKIGMAGGFAAVVCSPNEAVRLLANFARKDTE